MWLHVYINSLLELDMCKLAPQLLVNWIFPAHWRVSPSILPFIDLSELMILIISPPGLEDNVSTLCGSRDDEAGLC